MFFINYISEEKNMNNINKKIIDYFDNIFFTKKEVIIELLLKIYLKEFF